MKLGLLFCGQADLRGGSRVVEQANPSGLLLSAPSFFCAWPVLASRGHRLWRSGLGGLLQLKSAIAAAVDAADAAIGARVQLLLLAGDASPGLPGPQITVASSGGVSARPI